jgi:hypothetical protein
LLATQCRRLISIQQDGKTIILLIAKRKIILIFTTQAIKRSLFGRSLCFVRLFQSVVPSSVPQTLHSTKKYSSLKISSYIFSAVSFLIFTRSLPAFGRAYASTIPLHFVTVIRSLNAPFHFAKSSLFPFSTFQPYYVCRPQCFQRLLLRTAIGVGSVRKNFTLP